MMRELVDERVDTGVQPPDPSGDHDPGLGADPDRNLEFFDEFPTAATTRTVYDNLDFLRGWRCS